MEWWQIISALAAVFIAISQFYIWVWPALKRNRREKQKVNAIIKETLKNAIDSAKEYKYPRLSKLQEIIEDVHISGKLWRQLAEIMDLTGEYEKWLREAFRVINSEVVAQSRDLETLDEVFTSVFHSNLENVFSGTEGSVSENIYKAVYKNELTFDMVKESVLKDRWDEKVTVRDKHGEVKELIFKDIIDGRGFHKFIENLIKLQNRTSIITLRDAQVRFLEKAESILEEVS